MIEDYIQRTGSSYADLHLRSDGLISTRMLKRMHHGQMRVPPSPKAIASLAQALDISEISVLLAVAYDFGLACHPMPLLCHELPPSAHKLTRAERAKVINLIRELTKDR